ncbi:TlpA family protein disulfide reductase [Pedobacter sp. MC2016-14]|uniref:TlpA family protein disulfide reductase n=1 Tax=Pedobacter sp. MC2016-14 TaxID=2897327 RepID=UPI001E5180E7|nr:TlpA disulfide reductase family protein [Pedobacter sp. MC2016-14]MCD0490662.1 TlpA family protein disulfide reductase [Pedobacter sp. MC2016-14]
MYKLKTKIIVLLGLSLAIPLMLNAQQHVGSSVKAKTVFRYSPSILTSGEKVNITYNPEVGAAKPQVPVKGSVYIFKNFSWHGYDLPLVKTDTGYISSYLLPEGTAMVAYRFAIGDSIDRGARFPHAMVVYGPGQKMNPGGYVEWGLFRSRNFEGLMSPIVAPEALIEPKVLMQLWIPREFGNPLVKRNMFFEMANGIKVYLPKQKADSILFKAGEEIVNLPDVTEKEMITVQRVYESILQSQSLTDSLNQLILKKYPDGLAHRLKLIKAIYLEMNAEKRVKLWDEFIAAYPPETFPFSDYVNPTLSFRSFFMNAYYGVANIRFQKHELKKVGELAANAPFGMVGYFYNHYVTFPFRAPVPVITEKEALVLSKYITDVLLKRIQKADLLDRGILAPSEWSVQEMKANAYVFIHHSELLSNAGQFDNALKLMDQLKPFVGYKNIEFNTLYAKLLHHFGKTAEVTGFVTEAVKLNTASPEMVELLKISYIKKKGSANGFDAYYTAMRPVLSLKEKQDKLKAAMVRLPAINFSLENLTGKKVDLRELKGKIVVLDFWASWCFPCKEAMPAMQMLVNKYEPSGDVYFLFIATLEHSPNYKKLINDFLAAKKYNFNVLYDKEDPAIKRLGLTFNQYAAQLKLSGIPQKVIIDQNGMVRWVAGGFSGDLIALTDEVSYIVDELKKEKHN